MPRASPEASDIDVTEYSIGYSADEARIRCYNKRGVLSSLVLDTDGLNDLIQRLLNAYDKIEGL